jgi:hypothetical protein
VGVEALTPSVLVYQRCRLSTIKHLAYSGVTLCLPTPQLERSWLARCHPPWDFYDADFYNFDRPNSAAIPTPPVPRPTDFRLNTLFFPTSASRPAWFHAVATTAQIEAIYAAVGATSVPADLVFYDGRAGKTITASMRMLPERPFNITTGDTTETFWLLTLTDERYFWYLKRGVITTPASWANLYSQLATILGTTITVDTVHADYGTPSSKWAVAYRSPGAILDAVAYSVGQRVVVGLDGSVRTVNWETAQAASNLYFSLADAPISGGRVAASGIARCAPASVNTVFGTDPGGSTHVVNNTLVSLAVPGYGAATGLAGYADTIFGDGVYDGANGAALASYAAVAAYDAYGWRLADPDVAWPGIEPWQPTGWEERIEWTMKVRDDGPFALTTVRRGPWTEFVAGDYIDDPATPTPYTLTVEEQDGSPSVADVTVLQFHQADGFVVSEPVAGTALVRLTATPIDLTVREVDGTPSVNPVNTIEFDQDDGFVVSDAGGGVARIDFVPTETLLGCGLYIDGGGAIALNLTDVVQDGLYWDQEACVLGIEFDPCTLTLVGNTLTVDYTNLVGDRAETGLVVRDNPDPDCDNVAFDDESFSTTVENLVTDVSLFLSGGDLVLNVAKTAYTNHFNEQGVLINRTVGATTDADFAIDPCLFVECCDAATLTVEALRDVSGGTAPLEVNFTATPTGGVGPYTYLWDFGDGSPTSTTQNPTHIYTTPGSFVASVTVTDACGRTASDDAPAVTVIAAIQTDCCEDPVPAILYMHEASCGCLMGEVVVLTYVSGATWVSEEIECGESVLSFEWECIEDAPGVFLWQMTVHCLGDPDTLGSTVDCDFTAGVVITVPTIGTCCDIGFGAIITDSATPPPP